MTGDTEGAFPIPSLPLKGNKESENTRKHLWTHSLCGFWVSPPSSTRCSPAFGAGVWDEPSCRLPGAALPFPGDGDTRGTFWQGARGLCGVRELCVEVGLSRMIQTRRSPRKAGKTATSGAASCSQRAQSGLQKSVSSCSPARGLLFPAVPGSVSFFPSLNDTLLLVKH